MTEQEMDYLAEVISQKVMDKLIAKQKEWDMQFTNDVANIMKADPNIRMIDERRIITC